MFEIGEVVSYNQYICKIKSIKKNNNDKYYVMNPVDDETLVIEIPIENKNGSIKKIMTYNEAIKLIENINNIEVINSSDKYVEQQYKDLLKTRNKENIVKVIKTAYLRNKEREEKNKKISEKDMLYLEKAEKLLYNELSFSLKKSYDETKQFIYDYCSKNE